MKSGFSTLLFYIAITISAADYTSEGFSAETSKNGIVKQLRYKGTPLLSGIQLNGSYHPGEEKHDARFFQSWDYSRNRVCVVFERGEEMLLEKAV